MSRFIAPLAGAALFVSACATGASDPETQKAAAISETVQTSLGAVRGETVTENGLTAYIYRGLPYATPPVGDLRWKAPQPPQAWEGVRDATQWPDRCPQGESSMGAGGPISEDCLYLNVVTAAKSSDEKRPVMVFFHGGGLTSGTGNSTTYNHPMLPNKGVVLVTVNSRLGPIGYLAHEEFGEGSGNFGTLDLNASLKWVQANIAAFGGDPDNVTIFGESGGGTKTISQMATPLSRGLFDKAIVQSGSALASSNSRITMKDKAEKKGADLAAKLGASSLAEMKAASWQDVIKAGADIGFRASVVVEGDIIPRPVNEMFKAGEQALVPLMVGANEGEKGLLEKSVPGMANAHSAAGAPTYVYNFTQLPKGWRSEKGCVAFHGLELSYMFGAIPVGLTSRTTQFLAGRGGCTVHVPEHDAEDLRVADESATLWAQFAKTGDPAVDGLIDWPAYSMDNRIYLDIGAPMTVKTDIEKSYVAPILKGN